MAKVNVQEGQIGLILNLNLTITKEDIFSCCHLWNHSICFLMTTHHLTMATFRCFNKSILEEPHSGLFCVLKTQCEECGQTSSISFSWYYCFDL